MEQITTDKLNALYPTPVIRGTRITRMEERKLERLRMTSETARSLGEENIGVFIGYCTDLDYTVYQIRQIDRCKDGGCWIVIPSTRRFAAAVYQRWLDSADVWYVEPKKVPSSWRGEKTIFCLPEALADLSAMILKESVEIAGVLVLDMQCTVHKARGFNNGKFRVCHDRPQLIADFRACLSQGNWAPPLVFFSQRPAKSVSTDSMQRAYCLEAFQFVDGKTLKCGPLLSSTSVSENSDTHEPVAVGCCC